MEFNPQEIFESSEIDFITRKARPENETHVHFVNMIEIVSFLIRQKTGVDRVILSSDQMLIIDSLCNWLCGQFKPQAGILLIGSIGSGKTTIMQGFVKYYCKIYNKVINEYHSKTLPLAYKKEGIEYFYKRPIFIDDLGKESPITTDWGQKFDTWADLFSIRYEKRALTFATANYKLDGQFKDIYGEVIVSRMREHFNVFELKGESFRK